MLALATAVGCKQGLALEQQDDTSACGGFAAQTSSTVWAVGDYCDAEMFYWEYDSAAQSLSLANERILLNCCGEHSMTVVEEDGVYVVTERDAPEFSDARCGCMCVFDFSVDVQGIPLGTIPIRVVRNVTDNEDGPEVVLEESIDLGEGSGAFVIDPIPTDWCGEGGD